MELDCWRVIATSNIRVIPIHKCCLSEFVDVYHPIIALKRVYFDESNFIRHYPVGQQLDHLTNHRRRLTIQGYYWMAETTDRFVSCQ